ncbi:MAG: FAD-dependent oxidoreductase [Flammeovirgaceae bacterium]|nr:FAD-dependent oxidoreductase [Flammeovirgaceae bacterium]
MNRRKALKQIGLGLSAGIALPPFLTSCKDDNLAPEINYDGTIAIIGAGAAGLYAADILRSKGVNVIVLEADKQMGGRIRSLRNQNDIDFQSDADFPVELGAEITYGSDSIFGRIIQNYNLPVVDLNLVAEDQYILDSVVKNSTDWGGDSDFVAVQNFISGLPNYSGGSATIDAAATGLTSRAKALLNSQVGNFYGSSNTRLGAVGISEELSLQSLGNQRLMVKSNPLQDVLLSRFSNVKPLVQLETQVKSIDYQSEPAIITDQNGNQIEANKIIITVPLSILKNNVIDFSPALPATKLSSASKFGMDKCIRVILDFKKNFWGEASAVIWGGNTALQILNPGVGRSQFIRTMTLTIYGSKADELSAMGDDMITPILSELDSIYDGQATLYIRRDLDSNEVVYHYTDWSMNEFIQGGISYPLVNATQADRNVLAEPVNDILFFAGEATDVEGYAGTIQGAMASAERVVDEVVSVITA